MGFYTIYIVLIDYNDLIVLLVIRGINFYLITFFFFSQKGALEQDVLQSDPLTTISHLF